MLRTTCLVLIASLDERGFNSLSLGMMRIYLAVTNSHFRKVFKRQLRWLYEALFYLENHEMREEMKENFL